MPSQFATSCRRAALVICAFSLAAVGFAEENRFSAVNPPRYARQPVVTSLQYSPDGQLLAIAGFNEVFLLRPEDGAPQGRLVGTAERIETVRFSPDGSRLLVVGGNPARNGEIQIWDVANRSLLLSKLFTTDTLYGGSWSPDGKLVAFGAADNVVRAVSAETGEQVLFQGAHSDWVRDTVFSADGSHLISVGRDMTTKLTEIATQRFVDNVSSITPGALKGGIQAVARHPSRDEVVIGGSDGVPRVYRMFRQTARVIGDDANLIRQLPTMQGRIFGVAVSQDGKRIASVSSLDGAGELQVYGYEFDTALTDRLKQISSKIPDSWTAEERAEIEKYRQEGVQVLSQNRFATCPLYAVAFSPDGQVVATAGGDGMVRFIEASTGKVLREFGPAPVEANYTAEMPSVDAKATTDSSDREPIPSGQQVVSVSISPSSIVLANRYETTQILITAKLSSGDFIDATRMARYELAAPIATVSGEGLVRYGAPGETTLKVTIDNQVQTLPVTLVAESGSVDFIRDVNPVLSKLGCNQGTCHGAAQGKNGFKLSLRGYDPIYDLRALTDDLAGRRINLASAKDSLMLLKPTGAVKHVGGELISEGDSYYRIIHQWISSGVKLDLTTPRVTKVELLPQNPVVLSIGARQQMRVVAHYADGRTRDVTREAFIDSGNGEVAVAGRGGRMGTLRRGEAPILARYEGAYAATTLTVMGDRTGFAWKEPESYSRIDELVARKWERMKIEPSGVCTDSEFIRRVSIDLAGLPPKADEVRAFLSDPRDSRTKRNALIDRLIGSPDYVEYWTNKWADLLQVNRKFLAVEGATTFRQWIREHVANNTPYDQFASKILIAGGSNKDNPPASYYKILRNPTDIMENTTHLFLAVRFNCNKCHDHPFERWTQDQYYQTAAYFAQVGFDRDPQSADKYIGGTAVEGAKPLYELVVDRGQGEVVHDRTKAVTAPLFPYAASANLANGGNNTTRREHLAAWMTSSDNQYFAKSYVNRLWGYMFGVGIMEPIDDIRAGNPPTNPELLDYLTKEFVQSGFNVQHMLRLITQSRTYQLSIETNPWNSDDKTNYSHATARRLPAEVLYDSVMRATGSTGSIPGVAVGVRAAALPDSGVDLPSGFFNTFGRPVRESSCECERSSGLQLGPVMALISGPTIGDALSDRTSDITKLVATVADDRQVIEEVFIRFLNRIPTEPEIAAVLAERGRIPTDHTQLGTVLAKLEEVEGARRAEREATRVAAIERATAELTAFQTELAPRTAALEAARTALVQQRESEVEARSQELQQVLPKWEAEQATRPQWVVLNPETFTASTGAKLTKLDDQSILAEQKAGPVAYTITARVPAGGLTGIRLEAIADDRLPARGPGLSPQNGNFVLSEMTVTVAAAEGATAEAVVFAKGIASYNQGGFDFSQIFDGEKDNAGNGWALGGGLSKTQWGVLELKAPLPAPEGSILTFVLDQRYVDKLHNLGRFKLSATTAAGTLPLGLPTQVEQVLATAVDQRTPDQRTELLAFLNGQDDEWRRRSDALAQSRQPVPKDVGLTDRENALASASTPVTDDPALVRLRNDFAESSKQLDDIRLTMIQDLTWALVNSPEFLFNH